MSSRLELIPLRKSKGGLAIGRIYIATTDTGDKVAILYEKSLNKQIGFQKTSKVEDIK